MAANREWRSKYYLQESGDNQSTQVGIGFTPIDGHRKQILEDFNNGTSSIKDLCIAYNVPVSAIQKIIESQSKMNEPKKQSTVEEQREILRVTWDGVKLRHPGIVIRAEWEKYVIWLESKKESKPKLTIKSILAFEGRWLKSTKVTRINNPSSFKEKEKEIPSTDIQKVCDFLSKHRIQATEEEVKKLLQENSVTSIELYFTNGIPPKQLSFKNFLASKGRR